jgi:histidine ammonia-lyase
MTKITLTGSNLTLKDIIDVAENFYEVELSTESVNSIAEGRKKLIEQIKSDETKNIPIYGTNRGCGDKKNEAVAVEHLPAYQVRYIKAHNCGTGNPLPINIVRAIMLIRLNSFAKGLSGMRSETCQLMVDMLNKKITPWILEEGSVGASGDLVPLAMMGATMIALPDAKAYYTYFNKKNEQIDELYPAQEALEKVGLEKLTLGAKEAMGLTNGSNFIAGITCIAVRDVERILKTASISTALSLEAIRGEKKAFDTLINEESDRHNGQIVIAKQVRKLIKGSKRMSKKAQEYKGDKDKNDKYPFDDKNGNFERVQDRYSFRCVPQIHCATFEALEKMKSVLIREINSATDNPLFDFKKPIKVINNEGKRVDSLNFASGGNFHGQPLAAPIDYLKLSLTSLGLVTDKRTFSLLSSTLSYGLPSDLAIDEDSGIGNSGYMIAQYAGAARAAENRILSTPASVMSVSTAANQEDYVSMGSIGALHLRKVIYNCQILIAIELLCATRALQLTYDKLPDSLKSLGNETSKVYENLKNLLGQYTEDNYIRTEMEKVLEVVKSGTLIDLTKTVWE